MRARSVPGAEGIAITTSSGAVSSRIWSISLVEPSTFSPSIRIPRLRGSSSTKPIAEAPRLGLSWSSRTTIWPPEPAPITSTSCLGRRAPRLGRSTISRTPRRGPGAGGKGGGKNGTPPQGGRGWGEGVGGGEEETRRGRGGAGGRGGKEE